MFCCKCGMQIEDDASFCSRCGAPVAMSDAESLSDGASRGYQEPITGKGSFIREDTPCAKRRRWVPGVVGGSVALVVVLLVGVLFATGMVKLPGGEAASGGSAGEALVGGNDAGGDAVSVGEDPASASVNVVDASTCASECHAPMDPYVATCEQSPDTSGFDKWGNTVSNTSSMLCVTHGALGYDCLSCHQTSDSEMQEYSIAWESDGYEGVDSATSDMILEERDLDSLTEARGLEGEQFCLNEACHVNADGTVMTRDDLVQATSSMAFNPHVVQHGEISCSECHKAHRASVLYCTQCHSEAEVPEGWLSISEAQRLM